MSEGGKCDLSGWFSVVIQVSLLMLIFVAVKTKHHFERPRRSLPLFFLDGLKQLLSNGLIHFVNIFFSIILGKLSTGDQCGLYFISIVIDVTLGTFISFVLLYMFDKLVSYQCSKKLKSGNYFKKDTENGKIIYKIDYICFGQQTLIWLLIVTLMKFIVTGTQLLLSGAVISLANESMTIFGDNEKLKVTSVVFIIPVILNVLQFLVQDTFIKKNDFEITDIEIMRDHYECVGKRFSDIHISEPLTQSFNDKSKDSHTA